MEDVDNAIQSAEKHRGSEHKKSHKSKKKDKRPHSDIEVSDSEPVPENSGRKHKKKSKHGDYTLESESASTPKVKKHKRHDSDREKQKHRHRDSERERKKKDIQKELFSDPAGVVETAEGESVEKLADVPAHSAAQSALAEDGASSPAKDSPAGSPHTPPMSPPPRPLVNIPSPSEGRHSTDEVLSRHSSDEVLSAAAMIDLGNAKEHQVSIHEEGGSPQLSLGAGNDEVIATSSGTPGKVLVANVQRAASVYGFEQVFSALTDEERAELSPDEAYLVNRERKRRDHPESEFREKMEFKDDLVLYWGSLDILDPYNLFLVEVRSAHVIREMIGLGMFGTYIDTDQTPSGWSRTHHVALLVTQADPEPDVTGGNERLVCLARVLVHRRQRTLCINEALKWMNTVHQFRLKASPGERPRHELGCLVNVDSSTIAGVFPRMANNGHVCVLFAGFRAKNGLLNRQVAHGYLDKLVVHQLLQTRNGDYIVPFTLLGLNTQELPSAKKAYYAQVKADGPFRVAVDDDSPRRNHLGKDGDLWFLLAVGEDAHAWNRVPITQPLIGGDVVIGQGLIDGYSSAAHRMHAPVDGGKVGHRQLIGRSYSPSSTLRNAALAHWNADREYHEKVTRLALREVVRQAALNHQIEAEVVKTQSHLANISRHVIASQSGSRPIDMSVAIHKGKVEIARQQAESCKTAVDDYEKTLYSADLELQRSYVNCFKLVSAELSASTFTDVAAELKAAGVAYNTRRPPLPCSFLQPSEYIGSVLGEGSVRDCYFNYFSSGANPEGVGKGGHHRPPQAQTQGGPSRTISSNALATVPNDGLMVRNVAEEVSSPPCGNGTQPDGGTPRTPGQSGQPPEQGKLKGSTAKRRQKESGTGDAMDTQSATIRQLLLARLPTAPAAAGANQMAPPPDGTDADAEKDGEDTEDVLVTASLPMHGDLFKPGWAAQRYGSKDSDADDGDSSAVDDQSHQASDSDSATDSAASLELAQRKRTEWLWSLDSDAAKAERKRIHDKAREAAKVKGKFSASKFRKSITNGGDFANEPLPWFVLNSRVWERHMRDTKHIKDLPQFFPPWVRQLPSDEKRKLQEQFPFLYVSPCPKETEARYVFGGLHKPEVLTAQQFKDESAAGKNTYYHCPWCYYTNTNGDTYVGHVVFGHYSFLFACPHCEVPTKRGKSGWLVYKDRRALNRHLDNNHKPCSREKYNDESSPDCILAWTKYRRSARASASAANSSATAANK